jgi:uncharacterized membrane protein SpoIIM required for sporulation
MSSRSAEALRVRQQAWQRLETMLAEVSGRRLRGSNGQVLMELSDLYRGACADLAMADQYRLSPQTVNYLHGLVGRAHNTLYRSQPSQYHLWWDLIFSRAPQQIFSDPCVHLCAVLFFGLFALSTYLAYTPGLFPNFAQTIIGAEQMDMMESSFREIEFRDDPATKAIAVAGYIRHNTGIGLECFSTGVLILPGLWKTVYNATFLGACFGYMARPETEGGDAFLEFVTAHGAFELTAIALAAAAGLRIGVGWLFTGGLTRLASLQQQALRAIPVMAASATLFFLAAITEGLLSPSSAPYIVKAMWGIFSSGMLMFYFVVLGYPREELSGAT